MKIWLLRHGQATAYVPTGDELRELTPLGRREARAAVPHLPQDLPLLVGSPYVRAQQTADEVMQGLGQRPQRVTCEVITPDDDPRVALQALQQFEADELLVVCHQPIIGALAGLLLHGNLQQPLPFRTGSLVCLEGEMLLAGLMNLHAVHHPDLH